LKHIYKSITVLTLFLVLLRALGFLRTIEIAYLFGSQESTDGIFLALTVILSVYAISLKAFSEGMIPYLEKHYTRNDFISSLLWVMCVAFFLNLILFIYANEITQIIGPGLGELGTQVTSKSLRIFSFMSYPMLGNALFSAYLYYSKNYNIVDIGDIIRNIICVVIIYLWSNDVIGVVYAWFIGSWISSIYIVYIFIRRVFKNLGKINHSDIPLKTGIFFSTAINLIIYIAVIIDKYFLSFSTEGTISNFTYGNALRAIILTTIVAASRKIFLVEFTNHGFGYKKSLLNTFILLSVCSFSLYIFSIPLTKLFFLRGEISPTDVQVIATVLQFVAISLPFYSLFEILSQKLYSQQKYSIVLKGAVILVILKTIICYLTFENFGLFSVLGSKLFFEIGLFMVVFIYLWKRQFKTEKS